MWNLLCSRLDVRGKLTRELMCKPDCLGVDAGVVPIAEPLGYATFGGPIRRIPALDFDSYCFTVHGIESEARVYVYD